MVQRMFGRVILWGRSSLYTRSVHPLHVSGGVGLKAIDMRGDGLAERPGLGAVVLKLVEGLHYLGQYNNHYWWWWWRD